MNIFSFEMGAALGLIIGFLLSYLLFLINIRNERKHREETNRILKNVQEYINKNGKEEEEDG